MTQETYTSRADVRPWTVGIAMVAATIMIMIGIFHAIAGFAAILDDEFYVVGPEYAYRVDVTAWGWIHLILGIVVFIAGFAVMSGRIWARVVGITLAVLSAVANFLFLPYQPVWSLLIIALDVFVIWALCGFGRREAREIGMAP
jgi:hypothetical protein